MRKFSRFEKFGLMAAVIVACTFYYMKQVYEPQEAKLKKTISTLNKVVKTYNNLSDVPPAATVRHAINTYEKDLEQLNRQLKGTLIHTGEDREITQLISKINDLLAGNKLSVNNFVPSGSILDELMEWNLYKIDLEGSFSGFLGFLEGLKDLNDAVKVEQVSMQKTGPLLHITLNLMI